MEENDQLMPKQYRPDSCSLQLIRVAMGIGRLQTTSKGSNEKYREIFHIVLAMRSALSGLKRSS
jgi:hypothetical protein